jgi:hypothetical protein
MSWNRLNRVQIAAFCSLIGTFVGCRPDSPKLPELAPGVVIKPPSDSTSDDGIITKIKAAPAKSMSGPGLAAAQGGTTVRLLKSGTHELIIPLPQAVDAQAPLWYCVRSSPANAVVEYQIRSREGNQVLSTKLKGEANQEVKIEWHAVVLIAGTSIVPNRTAPADFAVATECVQSRSEKIVQLAEKLWPKSGKAADFALNIQTHIREMKQAKQPKSLDALGILDSGANGICTANANLAAALMRAKGVPARTMAVIPPISQRLEMHRIVEYFDEGAWKVFDPSSLHADIPMKPFQYVIMAKTTKADEDLAMKLRMGAMPGCPFAQEIELLTAGITPWGQDFFWTQAKPIAEFDVTSDAAKSAADRWKQFLDGGRANEAMTAAANARTSEELSQALKQK